MSEVTRDTEVGGHEKSISMCARRKIICFSASLNFLISARAKLSFPPRSRLWTNLQLRERWSRDETFSHMYIVYFRGIQFDEYKHGLFLILYGISFLWKCKENSDNLIENNCFQHEFKSVDFICTISAFL